MESFKKTLLLPLLSVAIAAPTPAFAQILEYQFNETGTSAASSGSAALSATLKDVNSANADLHSPDATGISGLSGDRAFDNTGATGMGTSGVGGRAEAATGSALDSLSSFTVQGWFKTSVTGSVSGARLMEKNQNTNANLSLQYHRGPTGGGLSLTLGTPTQSANTAFSVNIATLGLLDEWVFFAVTYDGTKTSENVVFYSGTTTEEVSMIGTALTLNGGSLGTNTGSLEIGNLNGNYRPFAGLIDNFRIYGETSGSSGALTALELESLRFADAIPEGSSLAMIGMGSVIAYGLMRRRRTC